MPVQIDDDLEETIRMTAVYLEYANHYLELLQQQVDLLQALINNRERTNTE